MKRRPFTQFGFGASGEKDCAEAANDEDQTGGCDANYDGRESAEDTCVRVTVNMSR